MEIFNTTWKVLIPIFKYPTKGLSIREISRLSKISHPSVIKIIKKLAEERMIFLERKAKMHLVRANLDNEEFVEAKKLYNIISLKELVEYIAEKRLADVIILFGSYSQGTDTESSDVDIYAGYKNISLSSRELERFEKNLSRKIQIFSGSMKKYPKELQENILNGVKLYGWISL